MKIKAVLCLLLLFIFQCFGCSNGPSNFTVLSSSGNVDNENDSNKFIDISDGASFEDNNNISISDTVPNIDEIIHVKVYLEKKKKTKQPKHMM